MASLKGNPHYEDGVATKELLKGFVYLGAPIGDDFYCSKAILKSLIDFAPNLSCLTLLRDSGAHTTASQVKLFLARNCISKRANHWLRNSPPELNRQGATASDALIDRFLTALMQADSVEPMRLARALAQCGLPLKWGGLGVIKSTRVADAAWCASYADCWLKMRGLWPELISVDIEFSDLPDLVSLRTARARIQEVFRANEQDREYMEHAAVFNPATQEREMDFRPSCTTREVDLPTVADMADPDCAKLRKRQRHYSSVLNLGFWR